MTEEKYQRYWRDYKINTEKPSKIGFQKFVSSRLKVERFKKLCEEDEKEQERTEQVTDHKYTHYKNRSFSQ